LLALAAAPALADEADPRRPAAISTTGVPVVPAELLERLAQYQNVREATFQGWAPDGSGMLVRTRFGNAAQLHRVYEPGGRREQVTFFEEPTSGRPIPGAKGQLLATLSQGGNENFQIYRVGFEEHFTELLTDGKSRNELGPVSPNGRRMIVASNRRKPSDMDLYLVDRGFPQPSARARAAPPRAPATAWQMLFETSDRWNAYDWSQDGERFLLARYVSINESYPAVFELASKTLTPLSPPGGEKSAVGDMAFAPDGRTYYLATDTGSEFLRLARARIDKPGECEFLSDDLKWDVDEIEVEPRTGTVAFTINEDGASRLFVIEEGRRRELPVPLGVVSGVEFSPDGEHLGFTLARPDAPGEAFSKPLSGDGATRWTYSEVGGLDPASFVSPQRIKFPSFDGREIPAWYYSPRTADTDQKLPVLIQIHGGPESQYRPIFSPTTQFYVSQGIAVIHPNVRGSAGYGKTYLRLDNAELREDSVKDIGALLDWIARQPELDASRVAVSGGSYGGYMVLASLVHFGDRLKAGVDYVGIANFITFLERTSPYRQDLRRAEYGDERKPQMRAVFERINPTAKADKIVSALLVAHGRNDPRVPFSEAEQIVDIVRGKGREVWTVYADNEGHGFAKKDNSDYVRAAEALFLRRLLLGEK
jgi:acetyl esterase/lipase